MVFLLLKMLYNKKITMAGRLKLIKVIKAIKAEDSS